MAVTNVIPLCNNGSIDVYFEGGGAATVNVRRALDVNGLSGWTNLTDVVNGYVKNDVLSNSTATAYYYQAKLSGDVSWTAAVEPMYAAAARFQDPNGWTIEPLQSGRRRWFVASNGNDGNTGADTSSGHGSGPKLTALNATNASGWGDHILFRRGDTFTARIFDKNLNGALTSAFTNTIDSYGDPATARPIFNGSTDGHTAIHCNTNTNNPTWTIKGIDISFTSACRHADFVANGAQLGNMHGIELSQNTAGSAANWLFEDLHIAHANFGIYAVGNADGVDVARIAGLTLRRSAVQECGGYAVDSGAGQYPSGVIFSDIDTLLIEDCCFDHNGYFRTGFDDRDSGTSTATGANTLTDTGKAWTVNEHIGRSVVVAGLWRLIASNTATVLTLSENWANGYYGAQPGQTSAYIIPYSNNSQYRHNVYIQRTITGLTVRNCIASHNQMMLRPGGLMDRCVIILSPIGSGAEGAWWNNGGGSPVLQAIQTITYRRVFNDGTGEIDTAGTGGVPLYLGGPNSGTGSAHNNPSILLDGYVHNGSPLSGEPMSSYAGSQIQNQLNSSFTGGAITFQDTILKSQNGCLNVSNGSLINGLITFQRCVLWAFKFVNECVAIKSSQAFAPTGGFSFANNIYYVRNAADNGAMADGNWFIFNAVGRTNATWATNTSDVTSQFLAVPPAFTLEKRAQDYANFRSPGNGNVTYLMAQCALNRRGAWNKFWTAEYVNDWCMKASYDNLVPNLGRALVIPEAAPTATFAGAAGIARANVNWTDTGNYSTTGYSVRWSTDQLNWTIIAGAAAQGATTYQLQSLPGALIYIQVAADNFAGRGSWSNTVSAAVSAATGGTVGAGTAFLPGNDLAVTATPQTARVGGGMTASPAKASPWVAARPASQRDRGNPALPPV
jgi:hypothetical protein